MNFNPDDLLNLQLEGANDTKLIQIPADTYIGVIKAMDITEVTQRADNGDEVKRQVLRVSIGIDNEAVKEATGMADPRGRWDCFLDLTPNGGLDMGKGKNVNLGKIREAVGMNDPTQPFSMRAMVGRPLQATFELKKDKKSGDMFSNITKVAALS